MKKKPAGDRKLSTIEMTVLGMAWLRGPCTIYAIMKELSGSETTYYKSRAGTAYSVSNRLLGFGLLKASDSDQGQENLIEISPRGTEVLAEWLTLPLPLPEIAYSADLVRLRFFFLGVVDQPSRLEFIDGAISGLEQLLQRCESLVHENEKIGDYFGGLATVSLILETHARIRWLRLVRDWVENPITDPNWAEIIIKTVRELAPESDIQKP